MKRIFYKTIVALISFAIGLGSYLVLHKYETVSLCEIKAHPEEYAGRTVRLRALVSKERGRVTAGSICNANTAPSANIEMKQEDFEKFALPETKYEPRKEGTGFITDAFDEEGKVFIADVIVAGYLDPQIGMGCFAPEFTISNAKIERVLSIKEFDSSGQVNTWLESKSR